MVVKQIKVEFEVAHRDVEHFDAKDLSEELKDWVIDRFYDDDVTVDNLKVFVDGRDASLPAIPESRLKKDSPSTPSPPKELL